jgi:gliding motility-associated-like protein
MHVPSPAGTQITMKKIQLLPEGNFLVFGNTVSAGGEQLGILFKMANDGSITNQQQMRVNNKPIVLSGGRVVANGKVIIGGIIKDGSNTAFVGLLNEDLSVNWIKEVATQSLPKKVIVDIYKDSLVAFACQLSNSVIYATLSVGGSFIWSKEATPAGLTELLDFGNLGFGVCMVANCTRTGLQVTEVLGINTTTGNIQSSYILGDGVQESKFFEGNMFGEGRHLPGIIKSAAGFKVTRNIMGGTASTQTVDVYTIPGTIDFTTSGIMDNAGDAMGFCLPQDGKLIFIKQFSSYQALLEHTRRYDVPQGAAIAGLARSTDGGYLFGLNTNNANELIFIKTDSIGTLAGCSYEDVPNSFQETIDRVNTSSNTVAAGISPATTNVSLQQTAVNLPANFDCSATYCPVPPLADSCLDTYYKTFRSNSFVDIPLDLYLMRNNNLFVASVREDRLFGESVRATFGLKLLDEKGNFIKGVKVYHDGISHGFITRQMDDKSVMVVSYMVKDNLPSFTFTLVSDNLEVIWSKSVKTFPNYFFTAGGLIADFHKDEEGNYYCLGVSSSYDQEKAKILIYKMDASGNEIWLKVHEMDKGMFGPASIVSTKSSLIVIVEGANVGSVSARLNKQTGQMLSSYIYTSTYNGSSLTHVVKVENDRIFYTGETVVASRFLMGLFDTTGKPLKFKAVGTLPAAVPTYAVKAGMLYATFAYYNGTGFKSILLKADSNLNIVFQNEYEYERNRYGMGIGVSDDGNIYAGGLFYYGGTYNAYYTDPYLIKYNAKGETGTCNVQPSNLPITDIAPNPVPLGFNETVRNFTPAYIPIDFVPDEALPAVATIVCSSISTCNTIKITGPGAVCRLNEDYVFKAERNLSCTIRPLWNYDTAYVSLQRLTDSTITISFKKTGSTWIRSKLNAGCKFYEDSLLVDIQKSPVSFTLGNDTLFCPGDSIMLNAGRGFRTYRWQDGSTDSVFVVKTPGKYFVQVDNSCGDVNADTVLVALAVVPALTLGNDTTICTTDTFLLKASPGFSTYVWQPASLITGQGQQVRLLLQNDALVNVKAITNDGCPKFDTLSLTTKMARPVQLGKDTSFCDYDSVTLSAGGGYMQYQWNTGSTDPAISVNTQGSYWVRAQDANGCFANDTLIVKEVYARPLPNLGNNFDLCKNEPRPLDAGNFAAYTWQDGSASRFYAVNGTGTYWVQVTNNHFCSNRDTVIVNNILPSPAGFLKATDSLCSYGKLQLKPSTPYANYVWSNGSTQAAITVEKPGIYTLTVKDANNCSGSDTTLIIEKHCMSGVFIPNAFTPNADRNNDIFRAMVFGETVSFRLQVYNRFGELVFSTTEPKQGWNGYYKGKLSDPGTYTWLCFYHLQGSTARVEKGTVVLIH